MAADNSIVGIRINGTLYPVPPGITHVAPGMMTIPVTVTGGMNTIDVLVNNLGSFTALQLCGTLTVIQEECCNLPAPKNLNCTLTASDQILTWDPVPGAANYELTLNFNDPTCCSVIGPLMTLTISTATTSHVVPGTTTCFSWSLRTVCENGKKSDHTAKRCFCGNNPPCSLPVPSNLNCNLSAEGQTLTWDPIPGAASYDIMISYNDPLCCDNNELPYSTLLTSATNSIVIPSVVECFSWSVRTRCADNSITEFSAPVCACGDEDACNLPAPTNLDCIISGNDQVLSWDPVAFAVSYQVIISYNDPLCCDNGLMPYSISLTTSDPFIVLPGPEDCFSWEVRAVCIDGIYSPFSEKKCSCHWINPCSVEAPTNLDCEVYLNNRLLSWDPVPGAVSYEVEVIYNDPTCCASGFPSMFIFTPTSPSLLVSMNNPNCYSWRVRAICSDGSISPWSDKICNCFPFSPKPNTSSGNHPLIEDKIIDLRIKITPNPVQHTAQFNVENTNLNRKEKGLLLIKTIDGKTVYESTIDLNETTEVDMSAFENGYYIYQIIHAQVNTSGKLVVQH